MAMSSISQSECNLLFAGPGSPVVRGSLERPPRSPKRMTMSECTGSGVLSHDSVSADLYSVQRLIRIIVGDSPLNDSKSSGI
jgi:hypothetical protein